MWQQLNIISRKQMKYCGKLSHLDNITYASRNLFTVGVIHRRTVTWHIPPPNSSSSFEVSVVFWDGNFMTFIAMLDVWYCL